MGFVVSSLRHRIVAPDPARVRTGLCGRAGGRSRSPQKTTVADPGGSVTRAVVPPGSVPRLSSWPSPSDASERSTAVPVSTPAITGPEGNDLNGRVSRQASVVVSSRQSFWGGAVPVRDAPAEELVGVRVGTRPGEACCPQRLVGGSGTTGRDGPGEQRGGVGDRGHRIESRSGARLHTHHGWTGGSPWGNRSVSATGLAFSFSTQSGHAPIERSHRRPVTPCSA